MCQPGRRPLPGPRRRHPCRSSWFHAWSLAPLSMRPEWERGRSSREECEGGERRSRNESVDQTLIPMSELNSWNQFYFGSNRDPSHHKYTTQWRLYHRWVVLPTNCNNYLSLSDNFKLTLPLHCKFKVVIVCSVVWQKTTPKTPIYSIIRLLDLI